jgi:dTDP-4-amino-4,6-dideoxygalactose transaminase
LTVPLLDLVAQFQSIKDAVMPALQSVIERQQFIMGPEIGQLEAEVARLSHTKHGIACASGTDALLLPLKALRLEPGDEVIAPAFTFFATAGTIHNAGGTPIFVDIDPATFNLDPSRLEEKLSPRTKAIQPVYLYGQCADMGPILEIARQRGIPVLEDACQAIGASWQGRPAGALGDLAAFSFYPTKNLGAAGDAGAVTTSDDRLAELVRRLRVHGSTVTYHHDRVGGNFRMDAVQAAVLTAKLPRLSAWNERRRAIAKRYDARFAEAVRAGRIGLPAEASGRRHVYHQYVVRVPDRDGLRRRLTERGVATSVFYPIPLHLQDCFRDLGGREGDFPQAEKAAREVLALPMFPQLTDDEIERVADTVVASLG